MDKTCSTCQNRNEHGLCTNAESVFFGTRVENGTCPVWENYDWEFWGMNDMELGEYFDLGNIIKTQSELADATVYAMTKHAAVAFAKGTDQMILDAIIQKAKENGITDLYVLNEDFILAAIREKIEREAGKDG